MSNPKVSIIIPVYNVEKYIKRCLESVVNQTYSNIEIIIINDESTDNSLSICKEYERNDNRIIIYSQKNGGLSSARNLGINKASGEYICFVDSDDWIEKDYIQFGIDILLKNDVNLVVLGYYNSTEKEDLVTTKGWLNKEEEIFYKYDALKLLIEDLAIKSHAWDKIYNRKLFDDIKFPEGKNYEDIFIMHKIFEKCDKIAISKQPKYHYFIRDNSIARNYKIKNIMDYFEAEFERKKFLEDNRYSDLLKIQNTKLMELLLSYYPKIYSDKSEKTRNLNKFHEYKKIIEKDFKDNSVFFDEKKYKIMFKIYKISKLLYRLVYPLGIKLEKNLKKSKYKERLKSYIYNNKEFLEKIDKIKDKNKIILMGVPEYDNLGDIAIGYASCNFIENNKSDKYEFLPITEKCFWRYFSKIKKIVKKDDIIFVQGGGNFGNQYYNQEKMRKKIITNFENNIYLMPATFYIKNVEKDINKFVKKYDKPNFKIFLREKYSYDLVKKYFNNEAFLVPDIVLSLKYNNKSAKRNGVGICIRKDVERKLDKKQEEFIKDEIFKIKNKIYVFDTCNSSTNWLENQKETLNSVFNEISSYELVITDKLHGMIFCAITGTPCIALGNYNYKVKGVYEWIKDYDFIEFCENIEDISNLLEKLITKASNNNEIDILEKYNNLKILI